MRRLMVGALWMGCAVAAWGQYTAKKVVFSDPGGYAQADLEAASGIRVGQTFSADDLSAAVQRLSDSLFFDSIEGSLDGPVSAITVNFKVKQAPKAELLRVGFQNFVWFSPEEIRAAIHAKAPLYRGFLPMEGAAVDAATAALQAMLAAKGIEGTVANGSVGPAFGHPERVLEFAVVKRAVVLKSADFTGVSAGMQGAMAKQVAAVANRGYNEGLAGTTTLEALEAPYAEAGYLDLAVNDLQKTAQDGPQRTEVTLRANLVEGAPYKVSAMTYAGGPLMTSDVFAKTAKLHAGDVASRKELRESLAPLDEAYRMKGYMDVVVDATATEDAATHTVAYAATVVPGEQYRVKTVTPLGLSAAVQADFDRGWLMKPGELYNPFYVSSFLKQNTALRALAGYRATFKASADPTTHLVDLTVQFVGPAR